MARAKLKLHQARTTSTEVPSEKNRRRKRAGGAGDSETEDGDAGHDSKRSRLGDKLDHSRWRMRDDDGRHTWHYMEDEDAAAKWPLSYADKYYLGLPLDLPDLPPPKNPLDAVRNGLSFFEKLQLPSGHWGCEYGGPMFLLPGWVMSWYVTKQEIPWHYKLGFRDYLLARAHPEDGGWGLHIEGESSVFGTAMNYAALRICGVDADHPAMVKARATLHRLGGATHGPHWAKFWLSVLGVTKWDIVNPVPPDIWLLPDWVPFAPWRWWIHIRMVFLPMGYLYSKRWVAEETDLVRELRKELFVEDWDTIDWAAHRNSICPVDNYHPKSWVLNTLNAVLVNFWNPYIRPNFLAKRAEDWSMELIDMENTNTDFAGLAPVSAPMNMVCCYVREGPDCKAVRRIAERTHEFLWVNKEGLLCNGTNGVMCWDTAFAIQAIMDAPGLATDPKYQTMLLRALMFLDNQQIRENPPFFEKGYRHPRKGGWAFSNKDQGYAVSDCVSEALKSVIHLQKTPGLPQVIDDQRIFDAVDTLLQFECRGSGACASYEVQRAGTWMEMLNAAEVFGSIMVEYEYPECTTAVVTALSLVRKYWPDHRANEITRFIGRAVAWIKTAQYAHGGWYGSWGVCFTYATMFALESLASVGETYETSSNSKRGCDFLLSKQRDNGGWSESYKACEKLEYIEHPSGSQVVMTAWALIGLMLAEYPDVGPIKKGIKLLMERQQPNGEWLQEAIEGVFNKTAMISYPNYKFIFPMKALGMFASKYPDESVI